MKISLNWLKRYLSCDLSLDKISERLTDIGLEVDGVETSETIPGSLEGLVVGYVESCEKHPDADKLSLTQVNVGAEELLPIVCGAPNVAQGQKVVVATVGTTLYPEKGDAFKIKKGKIRGQVSMGMICAEDEIGLGQSHAGIMVLDQDAPVGSPMADYINSIGGYKGKKAETDALIEIGLTPNRSDATSHYGVAFDLAAALNFEEEGSAKLELPAVADFALGTSKLAMGLEVKATEKVLRYSGLVIEGIKVQDSPEWLQQHLKAIGIQPTNNIVDITNFVLHEMGQPLHAFDYEQIKGAKIQLDSLAADTPFLALDGQEYPLRAEDLMICDAEGQALCMAGVYGGKDSGVSEKTVNIFLESACFDAQSIRQSSMKHNLRTDAATRFEKGSDPNATIYALQRAALLIKELAGGEFGSELMDYYPQPVARPEVKLRYKRLNGLIGVDMPQKEVKRVLALLDMPIVSEDEEQLIVAVPTNKTDVLREVDIIEEVLRIYGFNKVPNSDKVAYNLSFPKKPESLKLRHRLAENLAAAGYTEMMALSLSKNSYYETLYPIAAEQLVEIHNTSNQELSLMRPSMLMGGLEAILHNQNRQQDNLRFFELGKTYRRDEQGAFVETERLAFFLTGKKQEESWLQPQTELSYYDLKAVVENSLAKLGIDLNARNIQQQVIEDEKPWAYALQANIRLGKTADELLVMGRVDPELLYEFGIKKPVYFASLNWETLMKVVAKKKVKYQPISKFPAMRRDLALVVDKTVRFAEIVKIAEKQAKKWLKAVNLFDIYENESQLGEGKKSYSVSFIFLDENKTLKDKEVDKVMKQLMQQYEKQLQALIRR